MKYYIEFKDRWYDLENLPEEEWLPISGYVGLYEVSNYGRVKSLGNGICNSKKKILLPSKNTCGYLRIMLYKNGKSKRFLVHRLVACSFLPNWCNEEQVNHIDEDKQNNHVENLEWCNVKYNNNYGTSNNRRSEKMSKQILQYNLNGDFVAEFNSIKDVEKLFGFNNGNISSCCLNKRKSANGFIWKYKI